LVPDKVFVIGMSQHALAFGGLEDVCIFTAEKPI
jgi:hypothetical protein